MQRICLAFLLLIGSAAVAMVNAGPPTILALYDGSAEGSPDHTRIHHYAEMPLNHLGYEIKYLDVSDGLLDVDTGCCSRVLSWFDAPVPDPAALLRWSEDLARSGGRFVVLGETGQNEGDDDAQQRRMAALGLFWNGTVVATYRSAPLSLDSAINYERRLDPVLPAYPSIELLDTDVRVHLALRDNAPGRRGLTSAVVTSGTHGGYAPTGYVIYVEPDLQRVKWMLDPFAFFEAAYGDGLRPIPDVTTLSGRRIYFSQVDGDGWNNVSEVRTSDNAPQLSAKVLLDQIVDAFPDLPVTIAAIAGDLDLSLGGTPESIEIAREIFARSNVEAASHSYTHPYVWDDFDGYSREDEVGKIELARSELRATPYDAMRLEVASLLHLETDLPDVEHGVSGSAALPRTYFSNPFELEHEIAGSAQVINDLLPPDKTVQLLQWSGDAMPFSAAIRTARDAGLRNINGGDSRFDETFDSIAYLAPISRMVGGQRQIYAPAGNEIMYTNDWTGPYDGQAALAQTIDRTDSPRRLTPINLYYHTYSAERLASLAALHGLLRDIDASEVIPVVASAYAEVADTFFDTTVEATGPLSWRVANTGGTVRFDDPAGLSVDFAASTGVIGERQWNGSLYVALDAAAKEATVVLSDQANKTVPYLEQSRWLVSDLRRNGCGWTMRATGFGPGDMTWRGVKNTTYQVRALRDGQPLWERVLTVADGAMSFSVDLSAIAPVDLEIECEAP